MGTILINALVYGGIAILIALVVGLVLALGALGFGGAALGGMMSAGALIVGLLLRYNII